MMKIQTKVLPAKEFDRGTITASPDIRTRMSAIVDEAKVHGLDVQGLTSGSKTASAHEAQRILAPLHDAATILFLQWKRARQQRKKIDCLALARLFNGLTYQARDLNKRYNLIELLRNRANQVK